MENRTLEELIREYTELKNKHKKAEELSAKTTKAEKKQFTKIAKEQKEEIANAKQKIQVAKDHLDRIKDTEAEAKDHNRAEEILKKAEISGERKYGQNSKNRARLVTKCQSLSTAELEVLSKQADAKLAENEYKLNHYDEIKGVKEEKYLNSLKWLVPASIALGASAGVVTSLFGADALTSITAGAAITMATFSVDGLVGKALLDATERQGAREKRRLMRKAAKYNMRHEVTAGIIERRDNEQIVTTPVNDVAEAPIVEPEKQTTK